MNSPNLNVNNMANKTLFKACIRFIFRRISKGEMKQALMTFYRTKIIMFLILALAANHVSGQIPESSYNFAFGSSAKGGKSIAVSGDSKYKADLGYGFDFDSQVKFVKTQKGKLSNGYITSDHPFYFSVNISEGNYKVTVTLGSVSDTSQTTIRAESRRLMLNHFKTKDGEIKTVSFIVNIRNPRIGGKDSVILKPDERAKYDWDNKLTLEFSDDHPCLNALQIEKVSDQVTVYLAGNSTVVNQENEPWAAWGQMIPSFFKPGVAFSNHAQSGLTAGSFIDSKRLEKILSIIKPGDYYFMEFGHNDQKEVGPNDGAYKSYTERLKLMIGKVRQKGAIPVIVTSTSRRVFNDSGKVINTLGDYPAAAKAVAVGEKVALIDLNAMSARFYEALGNEGSKRAFVWYPAGTWPGQKEDLHDNTHFTTYGAYELAKCVIEGIKSNNLGIARFLISQSVFDPSHPDNAGTFKMTITPKRSLKKPEGS